MLGTKEDGLFIIDTPPKKDQKYSAKVKRSVKMSPNTRIADLAATIQEHTSKVDEYLASNNIPSPSFDVSCPLRLSLPLDIQASRNAVLEASDDLYMQGIQNARVRDPNDWEQLFASVDERFKSFGVGTDDGSELSTVCVMWDGEDMFEV
ncbi:hypothetical protein BCON_0069g00040 [Botryotinia convoluta]|uniref:Uncharacterized protein n=1 Tax=Botryotinia convoluta TaxID=54673 RepID=A0A4Z1IDM6_9HELO|nr:hypothetical protein BCON_0069g00040 [Botryotinia convoluta]